MHQVLRLLGLAITQDNHPDTRCRASQRIELLQVHRLIQIHAHDASVIVVRAERRVSCAPPHRKISPESRMVELLAQLAAVLDIRTTSSVRESCVLAGSDAATAAVSRRC